MQTDRPAKMTSRLRALRFAVFMLLVICCGWFFCTRPDSFDTRFLCTVFLVFVFPIIMEFAVKRGYLKVRSQDSWLRIIGATIFIIAAAVLVSAVGIFIVLGLR
jgi:hypothetical protein